MIIIQQYDLYSRNVLKRNIRFLSQENLPILQYLHMSSAYFLFSIYNAVDCSFGCFGHAGLIYHRSAESEGYYSSTNIQSYVWCLQSFMEEDELVLQDFNRLIGFAHEEMSIFLPPDLNTEHSCFDIGALHLKNRIRKDN